MLRTITRKSEDAKDKTNTSIAPNVLLSENKVMKTKTLPTNPNMMTRTYMPRKGAITSGSMF